MTEANAQLAALALQFACGWCVCLVFCVVGRLLSKSKAWVRYAVEIPTAILGLVFVWWCNLNYADGQFRVVFVVAILLGCLAYYTICKEILDKTFVSLYNFFTKKR